MAHPKSETEWSERAARYLKAELKRDNLTYEELATRLEKFGFEETRASITNKLFRGSQSSAFFLATLLALGRESLKISDI
jgi:hypothetical protein